MQYPYKLTYALYIPQWIGLHVVGLVQDVVDNQPYLMTLIVGIIRCSQLAAQLSEKATYTSCIKSNILISVSLSPYGTL